MPFSFYGTEYALLSEACQTVYPLPESNAPAVLHGLQFFQALPAHFHNRKEYWKQNHRTFFSTDESNPADVQFHLTVLRHMPFHPFSGKYHWRLPATESNCSIQLQTYGDNLHPDPVWIPSLPLPYR